MGKFINKNLKETKRIFLQRLMVSFRSLRKLRSYLVRATSCLSDRVVGTTKCGKKSCEVFMHVFEGDTFTRNVTGEAFKINHKLYYEDNCLIYLL